ncbi:tetra-peptide repeat homeobox protein 1-like [Etheostoma cragini]|uniref:tetra-peptide repeat homeobox protein 1-like n=1 Tax=Etheostoma cragini TaxID=417921 RepID=UPI00155E0613|nr:tetra-peptide repeat homeobox protein 1-like [Etheostoma cragini]
MSQCEDREEGVPPSKTTGPGHGPGPGPGPDPEPGPSCVSLKSDQSIDYIIDFKVGQPADGRMQQQKPVSHGPEPGPASVPASGPGSGPSCVSMKSDQSMPDIINFKVGQPADGRLVSDS